MTERLLICDLCGKKTARVRRVTRSYGRGASEFLVRNIPAVHCTSCGETWFTARTIHELDRIKAHHGELAVKREVHVAEFPSLPRTRAG